MAYKSAEKDFYQKHYLNNLTASPQIDQASVYKDYFAEGKRYHLIEQVISSVRHRGVLLELGCSTGATVGYLAAKYAFERNVGVDIAFDEQSETERVNPIEYISANCNERLPFEDSSIDLLVAMMVIEHLFNPFHSFAEINRLLSDGGIAVVNLPLVTSLRNRLRLLFGKLPITSVPFERWMTDGEWDGNHLHYFSVETIRRLCDSCGLRIVKTSSVGRFHKIKNFLPSMFAGELTFAVQRKT
jgi:SAM-dependent methyltransferase